MCCLVLDNSTACHSFHLLLQETEKKQSTSKARLLLLTICRFCPGEQNAIYSLCSSLYNPVILKHKTTATTTIIATTRIKRYPEPVVGLEENTSKTPQVFKICFDFQCFFKERDSKMLIFVEETMLVEIWENGRWEDRLSLSDLPAVAN